MDVAVVGGGLQGCAIALELARRDVGVELFDRRPALYDGASRHSEGKVHLGFVYAADPTLRTARLMARGAAVFAPALRRWIGDRVDRLAVSSPFTYAVHRTSLRSADELETTYGRIAAVIREEIPRGAYFGEQRPDEICRTASDAYGEDVAALFETREVALDPDVLADELVAAVAAHPRIGVTLSTTVTGVDRDGLHLHVRDGGGERSTGPFRHIVNCAWEGRLALDASAGIPPPCSWSYRMKYYALMDLSARPRSLPSTTVVLGPYGDVVDFGDGRTYFSWYPVGRRGWSGDVAPPPWPTRLVDGEAGQVASGMAAGLAAVIPEAGRLLAERAASADVRGGVIYARGDTDVHDAASELHERFRVGPVSHGAYHTVDTGKLTLAPLFALELADRIAPDGRA